MTIVFSLLCNRCIRLSLSHLKNYSTSTNQSWSLVPYWGTKFRIPFQLAGVRFFTKPAVEDNPVRMVASKTLSMLADESIAKYLKNDVIPWQKVKTAIINSPKFDVKENNVTSSIFSSCLSLGLLDVGVSYYKDIISKGGKVSVIELTLLLKLLACQQPKNIIPQYEDVVRELYKVFKSYIEIQPVIQGDSCKVFSCVKDMWKEMVEICGKSEIIGDFSVIYRAFDFDEPEIGWKLLYTHPQSFNSCVVESYLKYCIRMAEANQFSVMLINKLVEFCEHFVMIIPYVNLYSTLQTLVSILNKIPNKKYKWTVEKSIVDHNSVCSNCLMKLNDVTITNAEYDMLKSHILNDTIINKNINLKTSKVELEKFISFLKTSSKYNFVIDGLNAIYKRPDIMVVFQSLFDYLEEKNKKCLLIGRKHLLRNPAYKIILKNCQVFLTNNLSDDDIFVIYAALFKGPDTYFLSGDFYRGYSDHLKGNDIKKIFLKWQLSHQYLLTSKFRVENAAGHSFLPQKTKLPKKSFKNEEFCWHLSSQSNIRPKIQPAEDFYWVCLRAVPV